MIGLTEKQAQCLRVIRDSVASKGRPPTLRELADTLGIAMTAAKSRIQGLITKGYVQRAAHRSRALRVAPTIPLFGPGPKGVAVRIGELAPPMWAGGAR
jgi:repressor LexA